MAWLYDVATHAYRPVGGRSLTSSQLRNVRDAVANGMANDASALMQRFMSGNISLEAWAGEFASLITSGMTAGGALGAGGMTALDAAKLEQIDTLIADQMPFAQGFTKDLAMGELSPEAAEARAQLYAGQVVHSYEQAMGQSWGVELPTYPPMDSPCGNNCRCYWSITDDDKKIYYTWVTVGDEKVCEVCYSRGEQYQMLTQPKAE